MSYYLISHLNSLVPAFSECTNSLIERLKEFPDGWEVPMNDQLSLFVMEVIARVSSLKAIGGYNDNNIRFNF